MAEREEVKNGNKALAKWGAIASVTVPMLAALFWIFQVNATATQALALAQEAKVIAQAKADADDIQRLDQDIRELRKSLEDAELIDRKGR